jgi:hypothetical protein
VSSQILRPDTAEGIYGSLAVAVVCTAWYGNRLSSLALEIVVYCVTLWLLHVYARVAHGGWSSRTNAQLAYWARREWPHLEAAVPALVVLLVGWAFGLDPALVADLALGATLANLLIWQVALLAPERPSLRALTLTVVLDGVVIAALVSLRLLIK